MVSDNPTVNTCPATAYQATTVCVPVQVTPFADAKTTTTRCCGKPIVSSDGAACAGTKNGSCVFTISQKLCVEVPVEFGAVAKTGDTYVSCDGVNDTECEDCDKSI